MTWYLKLIPLPERRIEPTRHIKHAIVISMLEYTYVDLMSLRLSKQEQRPNLTN